MSGQDDRVRERAHRLWENEGRPEGRDLHHWLKAEEETGGRSVSDASSVVDAHDVDRATGPSHGDEDFGGHDAESDGIASSGVGGQRYSTVAGPEQAGTE